MLSIGLNSIHILCKEIATVDEFILTFAFKTIFDIYVFFLTMFYDGAAVAHGWFSQVLDPASMLVVREPASKSMENRPIPQVWKS